MKTVLMFITPTCPSCRRALQWMNELIDENEKYSSIKTDVVDETVHPDIANQYDYFYVPTYYVDGTKIHEGAASKDIVRSVFEKALG